LQTIFLKFACTLLNRSPLYMSSTKRIMISGPIPSLLGPQFEPPLSLFEAVISRSFLLCLVTPLVLLIPYLGLSPCQGTVSRDFLLHSVSTILIFFKFEMIYVTHGRCTTGVHCTGGKFIISFLKFHIATGANDAGGKFATSVSDTGGQQ
jgi:hypothetical protein